MGVRARGSIYDSTRRQHGSPIDYARRLEWRTTGDALAVPSTAPAAATPLATLSAALSPKSRSWFPPGADPKANSWFPPGADPSPAPVAAIVRDLPRDLRNTGWPALLVRHPLPFLASVAVAGFSLWDKSHRRHELCREIWSHPSLF
jgi:hypothetical protein